MRRGDWKIHHRFEDGGFELYNLKEDIGETKDLSASKPEELERMKKELFVSYKRFEAVQSLPVNPKYDATDALAAQKNEPKKALPPLKTAAQAYAELKLGGATE